ncbi:hypothetical protein GCM10010523_06920 [Paenarthrobacter ilicis]
MATPSRIFRYSGSERPACRMNHTGLRLGVPPRYAVMSGDSEVRPSFKGWLAPRVPAGALEAVLWGAAELEVMPSIVPKIPGKR